MQEESSSATSQLSQLEVGSYVLESSSATSQLSQLEVGSYILEEGFLPPPNRFKKNSDHVPRNDDDLKRIRAYKLALRRETARNGYDIWNESSLCKNNNNPKTHTEEREL